MSSLFLLLRYHPLALHRRCCSAGLGWVMVLVSSIMVTGVWSFAATFPLSRAWLRGWKRECFPRPLSGIRQRCPARRCALWFSAPILCCLQHFFVGCEIFRIFAGEIPDRRILRGIRPLQKCRLLGIDVFTSVYFLFKTSYSTIFTEHSRN